MARGPHRFLGVLVGLAGIAGAAVARAQAPPPPVAPTPRERAGTLFDEGRRLILQDGRMGEGVARCEEAYSALPTPAALARLGACYEWAGRSADAVRSYDGAFRAESADANVRRFAAGAIERLTGHAPVPESATKLRAMPPVALARPAPSRTWAWVWTASAGALLAVGAGTGAWAFSLDSTLQSNAAVLASMRQMGLPPYMGSYDDLRQQIVDGNTTLTLVSSIALGALSAAVVTGLLALWEWVFHHRGA